MPKRWIEVEQSEAYQRLPPQSKYKAKKQYWEQVVVPKTDYIALNKESQQKAKNQFFGGVLTDDVPEKNLPNIWLETAKGTAETIFKSAGKQIEPIIHPIQTAKGLSFAVTHPIQTAKAIGEDYKKAYGGIENIAETVATDPLRFLTDVSMLGGIASGGTKAIGKTMQANKGAKLIEFGRMPTFTKGEGLTTGKKFIETSSQAIGKLRKSPASLADEATAIYREILNPGKEVIRDIEVRGGKDINRYFKLAAEEGLPIKRTIDIGGSPKLDTLEAIQKITPKIADIHENLNTALRGYSKTFDLADIADSTKSSLSNIFKNADELRKAEKSVNRYIGAEIQRHGQIVNAETLNTIKQGMWSVGYDQLRPTAQKTARLIGRNILEVIEKSFPFENIRALNNLSGDYQTLVSILDKAHGQIVKGGKIGQYVAGGVGALAGSKIPIVGSLAGSYLGKHLSMAMNAPERMSAIAARKMQEALRRLPEPAINAEIIIDMPIMKRLALPSSERKLIEVKTGILPSPKDVPYAPTGVRNVGPIPIVTPNTLSGPTVFGENPIKKLLNKQAIQGKGFQMFR